jgi:hypothetical protein
LEGEQLVAWRPQHREIVGRHDHMVERAIDERSVRHLQLDAVAWLDLVDLRERSQEGRPVSGDVDEAALPGHERAEVPSGAAFQGSFVGPVDEDHVQTETGNDDPPDRLSDLRAAAEASRCELNRSRLGRKRLAPDELRAGMRSELLLQLLGELVLLPSRVQARERVLPTPDDDYPDESKPSDGG